MIFERSVAKTTQVCQGDTFSSGWLTPSEVKSGEQTLLFDMSWLTAERRGSDGQTINAQITVLG